MEGLISKNFNLEGFHKFMFTEKEILEEQLARQKEKYSKHRESLNILGRNSFANEKMNVLTFRPNSNLNKSEN